MKSIGFHKAASLKGKALCYVCKTNLVPLDKWNVPCDSCKTKLVTKDSKLQIAKRDAAAIIETEDRHEVYVDKFGNEVENPGYDTTNDPRGWRKTGTKKSSKIIT